MMILGCLAVLLIFASNAQAVLVSDEQPVSELALGPMTDWETNPRIATSGDESLVVWKGSSDVKMVRIDRSGVPLDDSPLVVPAPSSASSGSAVDVVWDGARYVIYDGWLVMVSRAGAVEAVHSLGESPGGSAAIVAVSSGYLIADSSLGVMKVDREGHVVGRTDPSSRCALRCRPFIGARSDSIVGVDQVHLATGGLEAMMVWHVPARGAFGRQISIDGVADGPVITLGSTATTANVAWTGQQYVFVWSDPGGLWAQTPSSSPHLLYNGFVQYPALASDGSSILVIWKESVSNNSFARAFGFFAMRITLDLQPGTRVEIDPMSDSSGRYFALQPPAIAAAPGRFLLAWTNGFVTPTSWFDDVYALTVAEGDLLTSARWNLLSRRARPQRHADIAIGAGTTWIVWSEELKYSVTKHIRLLTAGIVRELLPDDSVQDSPAIATNGVDGLVAYTKYSGPQPAHAFVLSVDRNGDTVTPSIDLGVGWANDVACGAADCLVVWSDFNFVYASHIAPNGALLNSISVAAGRNGIVAWNGSAYLIVSGTNAVVLKNQAVVSRQTIADIEPTDIASDGDGWLLVGGRSTLRAIHFDASGTPAPVQVLGQSASFATPRITWTGRDYLLAFEVYEGVETIQLDSLGAARSSPVMVAPGGYLPAIASSGDGVATIVYEVVRSDRPYFGAPRVFMRRIME